MMIPFIISGGFLQAIYESAFYQDILQFDANILLFIQENIRNGFLTPIMKFITMSCDGGIIWIALSVLLMIFPKTRKMGFCSAISLIFSVLICNVFLKNLFGRIRPYEVISGLELLVEEADDPSFPSGHTSASVAAALSIFLVSLGRQRVAAIIAIIYAFLVGFTRLYVGIHYPTDVIVAAVVAVALAFVGAILGGKLYDFLGSKEKMKKIFPRYEYDKESKKLQKIEK